jgi:hypothetical protein
VTVAQLLERRDCQSQEEFPMTLHRCLSIALAFLMFKSALQLDVDGDTSTLSPGDDCCHPKGEWIAFVVGMGFLALMLALLASDKS